MTLKKILAMTKNNSSTANVIICAAGSSTRMGGSIKKEYLPLNDGTALSEAVKKILDSVNVEILAIAIPAGGQEEAKKALFSDNSMEQKMQDTKLIFTAGGATRQKSVFNALQAIAAHEPESDLVLIHDGARPFVTEKIIKDTLEATEKWGAAVPGITPVDTQKLMNDSGFIEKHLLRSQMTAVQTPQGFKLKELLKAHKAAENDGKEYTDDTEIWGKYCGDVKVVQGDSCNKKITYTGDYTFGKQNMNIKIGLGYDLHRLVEGRKLIIGGIEFPFEKGEDGHSDGDALLHAITDALLGASGLGDIGSFFPPEDKKWKDADSVELLKTIWKKVRENGWNLINLDCVVKLEKPKFLPERQNVIQNIANALGVEPEKIFVKAKTGEKLDSVGAGNAIEAWATCLLSR